MDAKPALTRQYHAALAMLKQAIEECPEELWDDGESHDVPFWRVSYHVLYFTHLYLHPTHAAYRPWGLHREDIDDLPWPPGAETKVFDAYTKEQILDFWSIVDGFVDGAVDQMDLAGLCGMPWHAEMGKFEHQLHNLRHIAHHTGILSGRIRAATGTVIRWVRPKP